MRNPAGQECRYFYGDYYRGRNQEECRLLGPAGLVWKPETCKSCPMPAILRANACTHMILEPKLERSFPLGKGRVKVKPYCTKTGREKFNPHTGCGECHPLNDIFMEADS